MLMRGFAIGMKMCRDLGDDKIFDERGHSFFFIIDKDR